MFPEVNYISDVTLAPKDHQSKSSHQPICKYNQSGFCKFGERCNQMHINTVCNKLTCSKSLCNERHPKVCKFGPRS